MGRRWPMSQTLSSSSRNSVYVPPETSQDISSFGQSSCPCSPVATARSILWRRAGGQRRERAKRVSERLSCAYACTYIHHNPNMLLYTQTLCANMYIQTYILARMHTCILPTVIRHTSTYILSLSLSHTHTRACGALARSRTCARARACVCVCFSVCAHVRVSACMCVYELVYVYIYILMYVCMYMCMCMCICIYLYIYICMYIHMYIYIYTVHVRIYIYMCKYAHTHTFKQACMHT